MLKSYQNKANMIKNSIHLAHASMKKWTLSDDDEDNDNDYNDDVNAKGTSE